MAGKAKRHGGYRKPSSRPSSARASSEGPQGHLGIKSSPFAVTDSKLINQYMVQNHMTAHYRNLVSAKPCVDTTPPKTWIASQKVRDRVRREAMQSEYVRRNNWLKENSRSFTDQSDDFEPDDINDLRDEMEAICNLEDDIDGVKRKSNQIKTSNGPMEVHFSNSISTFDGPDSKDMDMINKMINDNTQSPSYYHTNTIIKSNIPNSTYSLKSQSARQPSTIKRNEDIDPLNITYGVTPIPAKTPRSRPADILEQSSHKFTEKKAFQPRILRTNNVTQSKLTQSKCYNAPSKRKPTNNDTTLTKEAVAHNQRLMKIKQDQHEYPKMSTRTAASIRSRAMTGVTEGSVDWMNETLMSRDLNKGQGLSPQGIPPLDISLDRDNLVWLREQSRQAQIRTAAMNTYPSNTGSKRVRRKEETQETNKEMNKSRKLTATNGYKTVVMSKEEELKYLEFITEVTNDVLDRGIFTNRVLKQVFNRHIERRKGELKVHLMKEKLEELRRDLQIPHSDDSDEEFVGMTSIRPHSPDDRSTVYSNADRIAVEEDFGKSMPIIESHASTKPRRKPRSNQGILTMPKSNLPTLKQQQSGRPPLPHTKSRTLINDPSVTASNEYGSVDLRQESIEEEEHDRSVNDVVDSKYGKKNYNRSNVSLLSSAQEGLDDVEEEIQETPKASSRLSSDITVTPYGETSDSAGLIASVTPINESGEDDESLLNEPQSVTLKEDRISSRLKEYQNSREESESDEINSETEVVEEEVEEDPLELYRMSLQHDQEDSESEMGEDPHPVYSSGQEGSNVYSAENKAASIHSSEQEHVYSEEQESHVAYSPEKESSSNYSQEQEPLSVNSPEKETPTDYTQDYKPSPPYSSEPSNAYSSEQEQEPTSVFSPEPSAPPTPAKRTSRTITQVSSMEGSQVIASSDLDDDILSTSSIQRPTPRKRSSISTTQPLQTLVDTKDSRGSEGLGGSELSDGEDDF